MEEIVDKKLCSGCHACATICPKQCIDMKADEEGFLHPQIDKEKCVDCKLCKKICPINSKMVVKKKNPKAYAAHNKDLETRMKSSSGGVFSVLAEEILRQGGVVFGVGLDENFQARHMCIENLEQLPKLRGSKYVQSEIGDSFKLAKEMLNKGRIVLFSGTPCQIGGLHAFLGKDYSNLYTQDLICHGVPSPLVWEKYLNYQSACANSAIKEVSFRDKSCGWKKYSLKIVFANEREYRGFRGKDPMLKMFLKNHCLRQSCYRCSFKTESRQSDITLADLWGIEMVKPFMNNNKGTSFVIIHSEKGEKLFDLIKDRIVAKPLNFKYAKAFNPAMTKSVKSKQRTQFFKDFKELPFKEILKKYGK